MTGVTSTALRPAQGGVRRAEQPLSVLLRILQARSVLTKRDNAGRADPRASAHALSEHSPAESARSLLACAGGRHRTAVPLQPQLRRAQFKPLPGPPARRRSGLPPVRPQKGLPSGNWRIAQAPPYDRLRGPGWTGRRRRASPPEASRRSSQPPAPKGWKTYGPMRSLPASSAPTAPPCRSRPRCWKSELPPRFPSTSVTSQAG